MPKKPIYWGLRANFFSGPTQGGRNLPPASVYLPCNEGRIIFPVIHINSIFDLVCSLNPREPKISVSGTPPKWNAFWQNGGCSTYTGSTVICIFVNICMKEG
ncbi:unnamed protein product [Owenia fusiformis]|uniref:Uncharacterized protein n=1 Tax=Owenia fusiformis TaxID=6347 RepID=A0A8S4MZD9_OWEFU|nr:unnamed protein product [Owenia fusiformis]